LPVILNLIQDPFFSKDGFRVKPGMTEGGMEGVHNMAKVTIGVDGMSCEHCESAVNTAIRKLPGIKKAKASRKKKEVTVKYDEAAVTVEQIKAAIKETGYEVLA
jgi:copper chaperone